MKCNQKCQWNINYECMKPMWMECPLGQHIKNEGSVRAALCRYSGDNEGWYADSVLRKMGEMME